MVAGVALHCATSFVDLGMVSRGFRVGDLAMVMGRPVGPGGDSSFLTFAGETLTVSEWSRRTGLSVEVIVMRLGRGWDLETTLTRPVRKYKKRSERDVQGED